MINFSKLRELSLPYNCYEVGHTWTPVCSEAALQIGYICLVEGIKIYAPLYFASQAIQRKFSLKELWNTIQSIYTSSCFISFNGFFFIFIFCQMRKMMGKFYYLHCSYLPAFAASFLAILIERSSRRGPLALYVTNVACETLFRMAVARGKIKPLPQGEIYLFSTTMALFLYIIRKNGFSKDFVSVGLKYLVGTYEAKPVPKKNELKQLEMTSVRSRTKVKRVDPVQKSSYTVCSTNQRSSSEQTLKHQINSIIEKLWKDVKQDSCRHPNGCLQYIVQGFSRPFLIGYLTYAAVQSLFMCKSIVKNPANIIKVLTNHRVRNLGLFLGGFSGTYRAVNCLLRWLFGRDHEAFAIPAAFLGGLFMKYFPNSTLALYLMWKLIEAGYIMGIKADILPSIRGSMLILYATSTAVLFYAAVLEPHNLKPAYLKFLNRLTRNQIGAINRHVLDIFGTHASKLYSDFWPELDLKHCSRVFQESVLLWLIH